MREVGNHTYEGLSNLVYFKERASNPQGKDDYQNVSAIAHSSTLSEKAKTRHAYQAFRKAFFCCCFKRFEYRFRMASSIVNDATVRKASMASAANCELPE